MFRVTNLSIPADFPLALALEYRPLASDLSLIEPLNVIPLTFLKKMKTMYSTLSYLGNIVHTGMVKL